MLFIAFVIWLLGLLSDLTSLFSYIVEILSSPMEVCLILLILGMLWLPQRFRGSAKQV